MEKIPLNQNIEQNVFESAFKLFWASLWRENDENARRFYKKINGLFFGENNLRFEYTVVLCAVCWMLLRTCTPLAYNHSEKGKQDRKTNRNLPNRNCLCWPNLTTLGWGISISRISRRHNLAAVKGPRQSLWMSRDEPSIECSRFLRILVFAVDYTQYGNVRKNSPYKWYGTTQCTGLEKKQTIRSHRSRTHNSRWRQTNFGSDNTFK